MSCGLFAQLLTTSELLQPSNLFRQTNPLQIIVNSIKEVLIKSFDRLRTNGNMLIPFVVNRETVE
jgi:hypothetical protein